MKIEVKCDHCGKEFMKEAKYVRENEKINNKNYCCKECMNAARTKQVDTVCACCGKQIKVRLAQFKKSQSGFNFCSRSCANKIKNGTMTGPNHPNYTNGKGSYRNQALKMFDNKCSVCGYDIIEVLEVHHKDNDRQNNNPNNWDVLCPTHHKEYQLGIREYNNGEDLMVNS